MPARNHGIRIRDVVFPPPPSSLSVFSIRPQFPLRLISWRACKAPHIFDLTKNHRNTDVLDFRTSFGLSRRSAGAGNPLKQLNRRGDSFTLVGSPGFLPG